MCLTRSRRQKLERAWRSPDFNDASSGSNGGESSSSSRKQSCPFRAARRHPLTTLGLRDNSWNPIQTLQGACAHPLPTHRCLSRKHALRTSQERAPLCIAPSVRTPDATTTGVQTYKRRQQGLHTVRGVPVSVSSPWWNDTKRVCKEGRQEGDCELRNRVAPPDDPRRNLDKRAG